MPEPKKRGRPRLDPEQASVKLSIALPSGEYDRLCRLALKHGVSVGTVLRRALAVTRRGTEDDPDRRQ